MLYINQKYITADMSEAHVTEVLKSSFSSLDQAYKKWAKRVEVEQLSVLYLIVDYWNKVFDLDEETTEKLFVSAGMVMTKLQLVPESYEMRLCPKGIVWLDQIPESELFRIILLHWAAGNTVIYSGYIPYIDIAILLINQPVEGMLNIVRSNIILQDLGLTKYTWDDLNGLNDEEIIHKFSTMLSPSEWKAQIASIQSGY